MDNSLLCVAQHIKGPSCLTSAGFLAQVKSAQPEDSPVLQDVKQSPACCPFQPMLKGEDLLWSWPTPKACFQLLKVQESSLSVCVQHRPSCVGKALDMGVPYGDQA